MVTAPKLNLTFKHLTFPHFPFQFIIHLAGLENVFVYFMIAPFLFCFMLVLFLTCIFNFMFFFFKNTYFYSRTLDKFNWLSSLLYS